MLNGHRKLADILRECLDVADANAALNGHPAAQNAQHHKAKVADKDHHRLHQTGAKLALPAGLIKAVIVLIELLAALFLTIEGFDHDMAAIHLFNVAVDMAEIILLLAEIFLRMPHNQYDNQGGDRDDAQSDQRHDPVDGKHHHEDTDQLRDGCR